MLNTDSMGLLWMGYGVLSVLVLISGYLALGFLPRLPRLVISWAVAGMMWMPANYSLALLEQGESYHGMAPAVVVAGLAFLEGDQSMFTATLFLIAVATAAGAACGVLLWRLGRGRAERKRARKQASATQGAGSGANGDDDSSDDQGSSGAEPKLRGASQKAASATATSAAGLAAIPEDRPASASHSRTAQRRSRMTDRQEPTLG